ncbi:hypothetical protein LXL04_019360 [Taraxacum kok-saghyz]
MAKMLYYERQILPSHPLFLVIMKPEFIDDDFKARRLEGAIGILRGGVCFLVRSASNHFCLRRADGAQMFVFLKHANSETSARPLLGADPNQCLQTSSNFLNLITSAAKGDLLSSIAIQQPLHQAHHRLQRRSSLVFSAADRRRSSPPFKPSISSHNGRFQSRSSADFS